jgi:hypothetical protein
MKKSNRWFDIQMVIAAGAMTISLVLWNLFAGADSRQAVADQQPADLPPDPPATPEAVAQQQPFIPFKILLGGSAPQVQQPQQPSAPSYQASAPVPAQTKKAKHNKPTTTTKSSRP